MSVEENYTEGKVGSIATPSAVGNDKQQTLTHPPEAAPEAPLRTEDDQDTISVREAWVQDVKMALHPLGIGPGDGSTMTNGGQNLMTPDTATAMSVSLESLSTPTVTGGGCPSDECSESQRARTIVSCSDVDADLLLHVRYQSGQDATTETSAPILSLRVSSTVLRMATPCMGPEGGERYSYLNSDSTE
ncbi:hypothetical protein BGX38DRAFT_1240188 [Terfezia claveryi]|nr:hypothetical protein BGX38DRAFT_1240188 [Terfezia claveryi]